MEAKQKKKKFKRNQENTLSRKESWCSLKLNQNKLERIELSSRKL